MISKIIALVIALLFMIASPVYDVIANPQQPVSFGAGDGESVVIQDTAELQKLLSNIPSIEEYFVNENIKDVYPDLKSFTFVENGSGTTITSGKKNKYNEETEKYEWVWEEAETTVDHVLEICFAYDAVYYHVVGETIVETEVYGTTENDNNINANWQDVRGGERQTTSYDVEMYYSKDSKLLKYNDYGIKFEEKTGADRWKTVEIAEDDLERQMVVKLVGALSELYGEWMEPKAMTEEEMANKLANLTEEEQQIEAIVLMFCEEFSNTWIDGIRQSNESNMAYIVSLSSFLVGDVDTNFNKSGDRYTLKDTEESKTAYLTALNASPYVFNFETCQTVVGFNVNSNKVTVAQNIRLNAKQSNGPKQNIATLTTISNVDNTVVAADGEVSTVYDLFAPILRDIVIDMYAKENDNG